MKALHCLYPVIVALAYPILSHAENERGAPSRPAESVERGDDAPADGESWKERNGIGGKAGVTLSTFLGDPGGSVDYSRRPSGTGGLFMNLRLADWLSLQSEFYFVSKGPDVRLDGAITDTYVANYYEFALAPRFTFPLGERLFVSSFLKGVSSYVLVGVSLGLVDSLKLKDREGGGTVDRENQVNSIDVGLLGGVGLKAAITPAHALIIEGRYSRSLTSITSDGSDTKNGVLAFMAGYQFSFYSPPKQAGRAPIPVDDGGGSDDNGEERPRDGADGVCPDPDPDDDGLIGVKDVCPGENGPIGANGCPDGDGDSTTDEKDLCKKQKGLQEMEGCLDTDADSIHDGHDFCPNVLGTGDSSGCRVVKLSEGKVEFGEEETVFAKQELERQFLHKNSNKRDRLQKSFLILDDLVDLLTSREDLGTLHIIVYSESREESPLPDNPKKRQRAEESAEKYQKDAQATAEKYADEAKKYLVSKGVPDGRVTVEGKLDDKLKAKPDVKQPKRFRVELSIRKRAAQTAPGDSK